MPGYKSSLVLDIPTNWEPCWRTRSLLRKCIHFYHYNMTRRTEMRSLPKIQNILINCCFELVFWPMCHLFVKTQAAGYRLYRYARRAMVDWSGDSCCDWLRWGRSASAGQNNTPIPTSHVSDNDARDVKSLQIHLLLADNT